MEKSERRKGKRGKKKEKEKKKKKLSPKLAAAELVIYSLYSVLWLPYFAILF